MNLDDFLLELEIYAKVLEASGNYALAAKTEMLLIHLNKLKEEYSHVS